jgi:hypothetical protein
MMMSKFRLTVPVEKEALVERLTWEDDVYHKPIPVAMECNVEMVMDHQYEAEVRYPNEKAHPGYENVEIHKVCATDVMVDWYTEAPDGTMTVYHVLCFTILGEEDTNTYLAAWGIDMAHEVDRYDIASLLEDN